MVKLTIAALFLLSALLPPGRICAQENSQSQRLGFEREIPHRIVSSAELSYRNTTGQAEEENLFGLALSSRYFYDNRLHIGFSLPVQLGIYGVDQNAADALEANGYPVALRDSPSLALGDLYLSTGYSHRSGANRIGGDLSLTVPTGNLKDENRPRPGSGLLYIGAGFSYARIIDPAVIRVNAGYHISFPGEIDEEKIFHPGIFVANLSVTELLNDTVSYTLSLNNTVTLPRSTDGEYAPWTNVYALSAGLDIGFRFDKRFYLEVSVEKSLTSFAAPPLLSVMFEHSLEL